MQTFIVPLIERALTDADVSAAAEKLAADKKLAENARRRSDGMKLQRWWSVVAGVLIILFFVLYSFYLTKLAVAVLIIMALFMAFVGWNLYSQRRKVSKTETEISPHRCADAFFRSALGLPATGRDISRLLDQDSIRNFACDIMPVLESIGIEGDMELNTVVDVTRLERVSEGRAQIPVTAEVTCGDTRAFIEMSATFALPITGDCVMVDLYPRILCPIPLENAKPRGTELEYKACPGCGARFTERVVTLSGQCPACGYIKPKEEE